MHILKGLLLSIGLILFGASMAFAQGPDGPAKSPLPTGWQMFSLGEKDVFKIALPRKPSSRTEDLNEDGVVMKATYHIADSDDIFVAIADVHDLPLLEEDMTEKNRIMFFEKVRTGLIEGIRDGLKQSGMDLEIQFLPQKAITFKGMRGFEQDLTLGPIKGRTRMLPKKDHIVIFFTLLMPDKDATLMGTFLDSFEFIKP